MMTSSNANVFRVIGPWARKSPITDEFPAQKPVTRSFDVFFELRLNKLLLVIWDAIMLIMTSPWWDSHHENQSDVGNWQIKYISQTWWRHQMETFSALLAICAGNSPVPKWLSEQSWGGWFETSSRPLWRHRNGHHMFASRLNIVHAVV